MRTVTEPAPPVSEAAVARLALDLGAITCGGPLAPQEQLLVSAALELPATSSDVLEAVRHEIRSGADPLGELFLAARPATKRREAGAYYTPPHIIDPMVAWALRQAPSRVVDAGCGSGRFAAAVIRRDRSMAILAVDTDPYATMMTRAVLSVLGAVDAAVLCTSFLTADVPAHEGRTAWIGNPPYVRHHDLDPALKVWSARAAHQLGHRVSGLAGLHALFFLATAMRVKPGDVGCFVTSSEWLDTTYGGIVRSLLLNGLGGSSLDLLDPRAIAFTDVMTTALITSFEVGSPPAKIAVRFVASPDELNRLGAGHLIDASALATTSRWSPVFRSPADGPSGRVDSVRLGDLFRVHRGFVTGANRFFILSRDRAEALGILAWCRPAVTTADEILNSDGIVRDGEGRRVVLDVPAGLDRHSFPALDAYLASGEKAALDTGYVASRRKPWYRIGIKDGAPIVASYMARQAPCFALNPDRLPLLNIGHGLYPRKPMTPSQLADIVTLLNGGRAALVGQGRTYHGGLEKFEPKEMEGLIIPAAR